MEEQSVTRSVPSSVGLVGTLAVVGLAVVGFWGVADGVMLESTGEYVAPTLAAFGVTAVVIGILIGVGARSKQWRESPYW